MTQAKRPRYAITLLLSGLFALSSLAASGCQVSIGGQTLPSPYYMSDDVQYFPPGPEFTLAKEAAALKAQAAEAEKAGQPQQQR